MTVKIVQDTDFVKAKLIFFIVVNHLDTLLEVLGASTVLHH